MKTLAIALVIYHFVFDWMLQEREVARAKHKCIDAMAKHLFILWVGLIVMVWFFVSGETPKERGAAILLAFGYVLAHGIQDWLIWNGFKKFKLKGREFVELQVIEQIQLQSDYWFWFTIALDQVLHLTLLLVLFL